VGELVGDWAVVPVVDTGDPNPSALGDFTTFDHAPSIEGATMYFRGSAMTLQTPPQDTLTDAVYRHDGRQLHLMMRAGEPVPGGSGVLENFDAAGSAGLRLHQGRAVAMANGDRFQRGMYVMSASTSPERVVARTDGIPAGFDRFVGLEDPQVFEAVEAFSGDDRGTQSGVYFRRNGLLFKLANLFTTMPNARGPFTDLRISGLDTSQALIVGSGRASAGALFSGPQRGVYRARLDTQQVEAVIDRGAFVPGSTVAFASFDGAW